MFPTYLKSLLCLTLQLPIVLSHPADLSVRADNEFIFAAIGDSWASGVAYAPTNFYDGDKDDCHRYSYAWSTVVEGLGSQWLGDKKKAKLEFKACSGSTTDDMMDQMDQTTRPKVTLMEVGGNNANFYPMVDACLFHSDRGTDYGPHFDDDDPNDPKGKCWKEINLVQGRIESNEIREAYVGVIDDWRAHPHNAGNAASLYAHGYPWFFGDNKECDEYTFASIWANDKTQMVTQGLRAKMNSLIDGMNRNIREAVERFQDNMITYIDINPAFHDHRFCEPNSTKGDQFNWNNNVWLWNSPARWWIEISRGDQKEFYDMLPDDPKRPDFEEYDKLLAHPDGDVQFIGQIFSQKYVDPDDPGHTMLIGGTLEDVKATGDSGLGGIVGRTLHPTFQGHESMGKTLVNVLAQRFKEGATEQPYDKENCPEDCTCFEIGISCPQTPP